MISAKKQKATYPVGQWFVRQPQLDWGAGIVRGVDHAGDSYTEFPAGAMHDCDGRIRNGFGGWLFGHDNDARKATRAEISAAKALFAQQKIDWKTGEKIPTRPTNKPAPAKRTPIPTDTKLTKAKIIKMANKLGAENAQLKARLAKGGK